MARCAWKACNVRPLAGGWRGWRTPCWATERLIKITDPEVIEKSGSNQHPIVEISGNPDDRVPGMVFDITPEELAAADAYEVSDYKRVKVRLASGLEAWVFIKA
jgi:hypothetical protein